MPRRRRDRATLGAAAGGFLKTERAIAEVASCCGVFREIEHSPGREEDDARILKAAGRRLEGSEGFAVAYQAPATLTGREAALPALAFTMCESVAALEALRRWEIRGVCVVNSPRAVVNTHRERMLPLLQSRRIQVPESRLLDCTGPLPRGEAADRLFAACWIKQARDHKTREGDVVFATDPSLVRDALERLRGRGLARAVAQRHVEGDLVKFYGVAAARDAGSGADTAGTLPTWFEWFYPRERPVAGHPFHAAALRDIACRAVSGLGLDVWGGDAIVTPAGEIFVIDLNAWPSFALFREKAADHIAEHLTARLRRQARVAV